MSEAIEVSRIWQNGPHCGFTDLILYQGKWLCAVRESDSHVYGRDGMGEENVRRSRESNVQLVIAAGDVAILAQGTASASRAARPGLAQARFLWKPLWLGAATNRRNTQ